MIGSLKMHNTAGVVLNLVGVRKLDSFTGSYKSVGSVSSSKKLITVDSIEQ